MNFKKINDGFILVVGKIKYFLLSLKGNRDLLAFLIFLVLSTGLWFLNALRKEYTTIIKYPVNYTNFPDDYILLGKPTDFVDLKIHSIGYNILPYYLGNIISPIDLNVSSFRKTEQGGGVGAFVLTRTLIRGISNKMSNGVDLIEINPDTLFVRFEKKESKKVPVVFRSTLKFKSSYYQSGNVKIAPDSVVVAGPASIVDTINFIPTNYTTFEELSDTLVRNIVLNNPANTTVDQGRVVVNIPVEPFTEKELQIPLTIKNVPDSLKLKMFPSEVIVTFAVAVSKFNKVKSEDFNAFVDYKTYEGGQLPDRLKVRLNPNFEDIKNVSYSPLFVECLFEKAIK